MKIIKFLILALFFTALSPLSAQAPAAVADKVLPNYRAYPLAVDNVTANMVRAGDRIDVIYSFEAFSKEQSLVLAATILQDIKVLDTEEISGLNYLFLSLSPVEAQYLALCGDDSLKIILRGRGDTRVYPIQIAQKVLEGGSK